MPHGGCWEAVSGSMATPGASQLKQLHWSCSGVILNTLWLGRGWADVPALLAGDPD